MRISKMVVTFDHPFMLSAVDGTQPAGSYLIETEEELLEGLTFLAYRRVATTIQLSCGCSELGSVLAVSVDPHELDAAQRL
jgi:hypothetical protein